MRGALCLTLLAGGAGAFKLFSPPSAPIPLAHTSEYDHIVDEHVNLAKVSRSEVDISTTKEDLSSRFTVYRFRHPALDGKWGRLTVFVDKLEAVNYSRSLWDVNGVSPPITEKGDCLWVPQNKLGVIENFEICKS